MRLWQIVAADRHGAQWIFLVESPHPPAARDIVRLIQKHGRVVELSGQLVEAGTLDFKTLAVRGEDSATRRVRGGACRYSIEGDPVD
ncbi:MAG TPA: hypothetical protein VGH97_05585 [Thermoanaerobaculia bacterium]